MGKKIKTREEVILLYLEDRAKVFHSIMNGKLCANDETRQAVIDLGDPRIAFEYAYYVATEPSDDLREVCCGAPGSAYCYALLIDKCPRDDTREAAWKSQNIGKRYRFYVDGIGNP